MANEVMGLCRCPLPWCGEEGAEVRKGEKGRAYIVCDSCVSMVRSQSRRGHAGMVEMSGAKIAPAAPVVVEVEPEKKAPAVAKKKPATEAPAVAEPAAKVTTKPATPHWTETFGIKRGAENGQV